MRRTVASLAAVPTLALASLAPALVAMGCGGDGAEPDAPQAGAVVPDPAPVELILDFQPNAVHAAIYAALETGSFAERGVEAEIREPGTSSDAPKLLEAGRIDLAVLDIQDLALARDAGFEDLVAVGKVVDGPLAAVIAGDGAAVEEPGDLEGGTIGVTGLPSDDAVLASVLAQAGLEPGDVESVNIGFDSVAALSSGQVDAATAFWNAEGVTLREVGVPTRELRVDEFGAPRYPELVLVTTAERLTDRGDAIAAAVAAIDDGTALVVEDPDAGLDALLAAVPELKRQQQEAQLDALEGLFPASVAITGGDHDRLRAWGEWIAEFGIVSDPVDPISEGWFAGAESAVE